MGCLNPMTNLKIYNSKDKKNLLQALQQQFGIKKLPKLVYLENNKQKIYVVNRDIEYFPLKNYRIDRLGLYIGKWFSDGFRPSLDGSMLLGPLASKNVIDLTLEEKHEWLKGFTLRFNLPDGFYFLRWQKDYLSSGKLKNKKIQNSISKERRLKVVNEKLQ